MKEISESEEFWSLRRWMVAVVVVFAGQMACIFWLGEKPVVRASAPSEKTSLRYLPNASPMSLRLSDPTLFALPNRHSFSGLAWLRVPQQQLPIIEWSEPTNWLQLSTRNLGCNWGLSSRSESLPGMASPIGSDNEAEPAVPEPDHLPFPASSSYELIKDSEVKVSLTEPFDLPSWQSSEILTNTVVKAVVDRQGFPISVSLLSKSGEPAADRFAVQKVSQARFNVERVATLTNQPLEELRWVTFVFMWHTIYSSSTNAAKPVFK